MNKTSRTDEPDVGDGYNQSPNAMSNDLVTNQDLNGIANDREQRGRGGRHLGDTGQVEIEENTTIRDEDPLVDDDRKTPGLTDERRRDIDQPPLPPPPSPPPTNPLVPERRRSLDRSPQSLLEKFKYIIVTFGKFVGPGFLVSVAYSKYLNQASALPPLILAPMWFIYLFHSKFPLALRAGGVVFRDLPMVKWHVTVTSDPS